MWIRTRAPPSRPAPHADSSSSGNIRAERYRSGGSLGYLTTDLNSYSQYGFFAQRQYALKVQITKTIYTQSPYPLEILTKNYQYENYTYVACSNARWD
jgi:hypothetical protein